MRQIGSLLLLALLLYACDPSASDPASGRNPGLRFDTILPEDWQYITTYNLDTNRFDDQEEWVVLYRFDLLVDDKDQYRGPISGAVYQPDGERPPNLIAYPLRPPDGGYLCECKCVAAMKDALSGLEGPELIVSDRCDGETTRLTIFHWDQDARRYQPKGHFRGDNIQVDQNEVRVEEPWPGRAQLAMRYTYRPRDNQTYYQPGDQGVCVECEKRGIVFSHGEPEDVMRSPYPEKIVLAFYTHYTDDAKAPGYFAEGAWDRLGQCAPGRCGCASARSDIEQVWVIDLKPENEPLSADKDLNPDKAAVLATVICDRRNAASEGERLMRWILTREDDRWQLHSLE